MEHAHTRIGDFQQANPALTPTVATFTAGRTLLYWLPVLIRDVLEVDYFANFRCLLEGLLQSISEHGRTEIAVLQI